MICVARRYSDYHTAQKIKFSIKDFFSICGQIRSFLRIWSHLLKKSLMENFIFCAMSLRYLIEAELKPYADSRFESRLTFAMVRTSKNGPG